MQWDGPTLVVHLKRQFGIALKVRQAQNWMHQLGYRLKGASHSYLQAKAAEARRFQRALRKLLRLGPRETVVFLDESGFTLHPRLGRAWAKRGQRLRIPTTSQHRERLNLSGWVAPRSGCYGMVRTPRGNRTGFLMGLRHLYRRLRGYTIWLYVDRAVWHRGKEVEAFVNTHARLHLAYLPRYQAGLNLQERIWRRVRYEATTNRWFENLNAIWKTIGNTTHSWSPQKVRRLCHLG